MSGLKINKISFFEHLFDYFLFTSREAGWFVERYPRASEVRARQFPSIGGFRRPDIVPSVLQYIVSFGPYFREPPDFSKISGTLNVFL